MTQISLEPVGHGPIVFFAAGSPKPKGSHKAFVYKGRDGKHRAALAGDSDGEVDWKAVVGLAARKAMQLRGLAPLEGCVEVVLDFYTQARPKGHFGKHGLNAKGAATPRPPVKPDWDKLSRSVGDALNGVCWRDDAQVVQATVRKHFTSEAQPFVGVRVALRPFVG